MSPIVEPKADPNPPVPTGHVVSTPAPIGQPVVHDRRCFNTSCRIEVFKGTSAMPLSSCPGCLNPSGPAL